MRVLVTVKAYPALTNSAGETMCVAGVRLDTVVPEWVRIWPVQFRDLPAAQQFNKWLIVDLEAKQSTKDTRPESYRPNLEKLKLENKVDTQGDWKKRKSLLGHLVGETTLCELQRLQGAGPAPSLGLVKVREGATAKVIDGPIWEPDKYQLAHIHAQPNQLRAEQLAELKPPPFQIEYQWQCMDSSCTGHKHVTCDFEVAGAAYNFARKYGDAKPHLLEQFGRKILSPDVDTHFFVGNQHKHPATFLVLGGWYPKIR